MSNDPAPADFAVRSNTIQYPLLGGDLSESSGDVSLMLVYTDRNTGTQMQHEIRVTRLFINRVAVSPWDFALSELTSAAEKGGMKAAFLASFRPGAYPLIMAEEDFSTTTAASSAADTPAADAVVSSSDAPDLVSPDPGTAGESADAAEGDAPEEEVPFHQHPRWQQVQQERAELRQKLADLEPFADIVQGFKEQGFTDAQAVRAAIDSQQQEAQQQEAQASEETWKASLAESLLARANDPDDDMTFGEAEATFRAAQLERDLTRRDQSGAETGREAAVTALAGRFPQMDKETVADLLAAGQPARAEAAARRSHERAAQIEDAAIARYNAKKAGAPKAPEGGGGAAAGVRSVANMTSDEFRAYDKQVTQTLARGG